MTRRTWLLLGLAVAVLAVVGLAVALWIQGRQQEAAGVVGVAVAAATAAMDVARRQASAARERAEVQAVEHQVASQIHVAQADDLEEEAAAVDEATSGELADWIRDEWRPNR